MKNEDLEKQQLTQDEVYEVINYADVFFKEFNKLDANYNYYNSSMEHSNLVNLNNNSLIPNINNLKQALADYKNNEKTLVEYNNFMVMWDGIYNNIIKHYSALLSFDVSYVLDKTGLNNKKVNYKSKEYKEDNNRVDRFLKNFNYKYEFKKVFKNMLINDVYFTWLRDSSGTINDDEELVVTKTRKKKLQQMPQDYCKITGDGTYGFLYDFDMNYFNNSSVNIENFDPSLIKLYNNRNKPNNDIKSIVLDNKDLKFTNGYNGSDYTRVNTEDGAWVWKFNYENYNTMPPFSYLLKSVFNDDLIEKLQRDKDMISASALILGELKTRDDDKSATGKDAWVLNPKTVAEFMRKSRAGIDKNIKQIPLPLGNNKLFQFQDNNSNMLNNQLSTNATLGATASTMIYNTSKMAQAELENAIMLDYLFVKKIYPQFEEFLNCYVNKKTKKYKFTFRVDGSDIQFIRDKEFDRWSKLSAMGIQPNVAKWASLVGIAPSELSSMMDEVAHGDTIDNLRLLLNTNTNNFGEENIGRPQSNGESANATKDYM